MIINIEACPNQEAIVCLGRRVLFKAHFSASDATEPEEGTLDTGGGAGAAALSSIASPGITHRFNCRRMISFFCGHLSVTMLHDSLSDYAVCTFWQSPGMSSGALVPKT